MADIIIRKVPAETKALLKKRAERRGVSLEADLREMLERMAREGADSPDVVEPFGQWLVAISRPGADLDASLDHLRGSELRPVDFEDVRLDEVEPDTAAIDEGPTKRGPGNGTSSDGP